MFTVVYFNNEKSCVLTLTHSKSFDKLSDAKDFLEDVKSYYDVAYLVK